MNSYFPKDRIILFNLQPFGSILFIFGSNIPRGSGHTTGFMLGAFQYHLDSCFFTLLSHCCKPLNFRTAKIQKFTYHPKAKAEKIARFVLFICICPDVLLYVIVKEYIKCNIIIINNLLLKIDQTIEKFWNQNSSCIKNYGRFDLKLL